ncbi:MAG: ketoacyl-ACP synthase III [Syntrophobacteraceae bacterium]|nr:ketoacyl-ACP synthase III [Syntrophobacteraceae bacterium]
MKNAEIFATGSYLPETTVSNEQLTRFPPSSLELLEKKTGILSRRIAPEEACTSDLALKAARKCLQRVDFPLEKLQGIVLSTSSPDRMQPATATRVQHELGATNAFAFDINSVCSGSTFGICMADALIKSSKFDNILFIAAEMYSKILHKQDFSTFPLFGDGAGAILFRATDSDRGVRHSCLRTDGSKSEVVCVPAGGTMLPFQRLKTPRMACFKMNGPAVFEFATSKGTEIIVELLQESQVALEDVDWFITHQANIHIIKTIAARLGVSRQKFLVNLDKYANTASASVLVALDEAITAQVIRAGDLVVTCAFGGGLSWGANLIAI